MGCFNNNQDREQDFIYFYSIFNESWTNQI